MRRLIFSAAALVALALGPPALAADVAVPIRPKAAPVPAWTWSGCYLGLNAGYGWGRTDVTDATETAAGGAVFRFADFNLQGTGAFGGGQFGCNWQASAAVFGIEADFQASDIKGNILFPGAIFNFPNALFNTEVTSRLWYFGTVRGRLGFAPTPASLLYATGGWAYGEVDSTLSFPFANGAPNTFLDHSRRFHYGYAVGAGGEVLVTPRMSIKAEYLYIDLGAKTHNFAIAGDAYAWTERVRMHTVKLGVNFLWPAAVVANY
jgi:outer membrane immunogenic protein